MENTTRKNTPPVRVYCLPEERERIKSLAASSGRTTSNYLLTVALGYPVTHILDNNCVEELARINGDLGRLGGLLKLWLTNDERTLQFSEATIRALLSKIEDTQDAMHSVIRQVVLPRAKQ